MAKNDDSLKIARANARARNAKEEGKAKLKAAKAKAKALIAENKWRDRGGALAGAAMVGLARRGMDRYGAPEKFGKGIPHLKALGEAGTAGAALVVVGMITGQSDITNAGFGALDAQAYLGASGVRIVSDLKSQPAERQVEIKKARDAAVAAGQVVPQIVNAGYSQPAALYGPSVVAPNMLAPVVTVPVSLTPAQTDTAVDRIASNEIEEALAALSGAAQAYELDVNG